jgi:ureidoacrylate peracid hydrolase
VDTLRPERDDIVVRKTASGVFNATNLDYVLRNLGIEYLLVMGVMTDQCVESAVRDACDRGFLVTLIEDACATTSARRHAESLNGLAGYCRIRPCAHVVREVQRLAEGA